MRLEAEDALAAAIVHRAIASDEPAVIATYAWDRLSVDPLPGPRSVVDFLELQGSAPATTSSRRPPSPGRRAGQHRPNLAGDLDASLVLLDPASGAAGMRAQLRELAAIHEASGVTIVDVGGDALAQGSEPGLRSHAR